MISDTNEETVTTAESKEKDNMWQRLRYIIDHPVFLWAWNIVIGLFYIGLGSKIVEIVAVDNYSLAREVLVAMFIICFAVMIIVFVWFLRKTDNYTVAPILIFPICAFFIGIFGLAILPLVFDVIGVFLNIIGDGFTAFASFIATLVMSLN